MAERDKIYQQIMDRGWHPDMGAFTQHYDTDVLNASLLLMPLMGFVTPHRPGASPGRTSQREPSARRPSL
jgi:GH15 family glucan-1,4-alpha-glucosidase